LINPVNERPFASKDTFPRTYFRSFGKMGMFFTKLFDRLTSKKESRILMVRRAVISSSCSCQRACCSLFQPLIPSRVHGAGGP
jgi:hypothetical protein